MRRITEDIELEYNGKKFMFPIILYLLLSIQKKRVKQKFDSLILVTGSVGSGKSTLSTALIGIWQMFYGREVTLDNFTWRAEGIVEFTDREDNQTEPILFDEAIQGGTGRDSITKIGNMLKIALVTKRRKRHLYILLVDEIQEYSKKIISRASFLVDVRTIMSHGHETRGYFKLYNPAELRTIYYLLKKQIITNIKDYSDKNRPFYTFKDYTGIFIDENEYEKKKETETKQNDDSKFTLNAKERNIAGYLIHRKEMMIKDIAKVFDVTPQYITLTKGKFPKPSK